MENNEQQISFYDSLVQKEILTTAIKSVANCLRPSNAVSD